MNPYILAAMAALGIGGGLAILAAEWFREERRLRMARAVCSYNASLFYWRERLRASQSELLAAISRLHGEPVS